ncbi:hypothetical protein JCM11251_000003 [Rhodosporidiobolus azoricus]
MGRNRPVDLDHRCLPAFDSVLNNQFGQGPCQVARRLIDLPQCQWQDDAYYDLPPLDLDHYQRDYTPPDPFQATSCICSMAVYNLIQACAACQQRSPYTATLWTNWVANCTMSNINGGKTFPYAIPNDTSLPDWACVNNAGGALSVGQVFRHATGGNMSWPANSAFSSASTATTPPASSSSSVDYTEAAASKTVSKIDTPQDGVSGDSIGGTIKAIAIAVPLVLLAAIVGIVVAYLRRKRKHRRRRHRLASDSDLPAVSEKVFASQPSTTVDLVAGAAMTQKTSRTSLFVPSESLFTRDSGRSFATNSISTGADGPYRRASTMYSPSTGFDTITQSTDYTYDDRSYADYDQDDDSVSPFSDIHRPAPSRVATRNNVHSPSFRRSVSTFSGSIHLSESEHSQDSASLLTVSSRGVAPSSSGATYGGVHDDDRSEVDDEDAYDGLSVRSRR